MEKFSVLLKLANNSKENSNKKIKNENLFEKPSKITFSEKKKRESKIYQRYSKTNTISLKNLTEIENENFKKKNTPKKLNTSKISHTKTIII